MQIKVINLASNPARWRATAHQFSTAGLAVTRQPAVCGSDLSPAQIDALYSARLNASHYHQPLGRGEIGCYASHLTAWRELVESGDPAMAIFEDDIEIEGDLPEVLSRLGSSPMDWDIVKLIGRAREKIRRQAAFTGGRALISYRRVPSLTGAYVITANGARKLLARRLPFGRPVDVDLRHWWECDLDVRGVWPYPVRVSPCSDVSTIGDRDSASPPTHRRLEKLGHQARYTWLNWRACQRVGPLRPGTRGAGTAPPAEQGDPAAPQGRVRRRNLVVLRAGDASLHPHWLRQPQRDFDIFVSYYGSNAGRHRQGSDYYEARPGPKWPAIADLLQEHRHLIDSYEAFWFPDDDLLADSALIDRMFAFCCAFKLCLAQPALTRNSYTTWDTLLQDERCHIRYAGFIEVMAPIFDRAALQVCLPTFAQSRSGWGLDWLWPRLCHDADLGRIAIIDATPVRHTRPVGNGELYRNHPTMDPRADAERILRRYGIEEVRAVAKYSFQGQVREVSLPLHERLVFWLKRLNGRRKHRAPA